MKMSQWRKKKHLFGAIDVIIIGVIQRGFERSRGGIVKIVKLSKLHTHHEDDDEDDLTIERKTAETVIISLVWSWLATARPQPSNRPDSLTPYDSCVCCVCLCYIIPN